MAKRVSMPRKKDRRVFSHTAVKGKKINLNSGVARGGIRL